VTYLTFRTPIGLIFTVLLAGSAAAQSETNWAETTGSCLEAKTPPAPCTGCSPRVAEEIRRRDMKRIQQAQQDCDRLKREEAQQKEAMRTPAGSRCPAIFSNPHVQAYATKAVSELGDGHYPLSHLSLQGVVQAFANRINNQIYENAEKRHWERSLEQYRRYGTYEIPPDQVTTERFGEAAKSATLDTWETCFPGFAKVLAEYRQKIQDQEKAKAEAAAEARKPVNRLLIAYGRYAFVKYCNEVRQGYLMVYVNDIELERARIAVRGIESDAIREDPSLNTDAVWKLANAAIKGEYVEQSICQLRLNELLQQAAAIHPENSIVPKDF
jgi:hypothetical protein